MNKHDEVVQQYEGGSGNHKTLLKNLVDVPVLYAVCYDLCCTSTYDPGKFAASIQQHVLSF